MFGKSKLWASGLVAILAVALISGSLTWAKKPPKPPPPPPPITYEVTFLGTLGGSLSEARDINTAETGMVDLNFDADGNDLFPDWELRAAYGINDLGWIVGWGDINGELQHAFRYIPREGDWPLVEDLGTLTDHVKSWAFDINLIGEVCGRSIDADGNQVAFYHSEAPADQTDMVDILDGLPTFDYGAVAINLHGVMIGSSRYGREYTEAFRVTPHDDGTFGVTWFSSPATGGGDMYARDINDAGQFVGRAHFGLPPRGKKSAMFAYRHDGGEDDTALKLEAYNAFAINNNGDVVGYLYPRTRPFRLPGFVYLDGGDEGPDVLVDLDDAVVEGTPEDLAQWQAAEATTPIAINDSGVICGRHPEAFVLTPIVDP